MPDPQNSPPPTKLLLCEGPDDEAFFRALIDANALHGLRYAIHNNGTESSNWKGGNSLFESAIETYYELKGKRRYNGVLLVSDSDDDPAASFEKVRAQAHSYFGFSPAMPQEIVAGPPKVSILMIPPTGQPGNLETACMAAAFDANRQIGEQTNIYQANTRVQNWQKQNRRDEMWLASNVAARCEAYPAVSLNVLFREHAHRNIIPLTHSSFAPIIDALKAFASS